MEYKEIDFKAIARADRKHINKNFKHLKFMKDGVLIPNNNLQDGVSVTAWYVKNYYLLLKDLDEDLEYLKYLSETNGK
jgi:hypothetical protein